MPITTGDILAANWYRYSEGRLDVIPAAHAPATANTEFFSGAYVAVDKSTGLAVRTTWAEVLANADLIPGGVLTPDPAFGDELDQPDHHLDTRGEANGVLSPLGLDRSERLVRYWRSGLFFFHNDSQTPTQPAVVGGKAYLVQERSVRPDATTHGLWVGRYHHPITLNGADGWVVDITINGVG